tara:strand:- start:235 stop:768 length:534 start_codon:yes stop_codon:yes gene_type:complete
MSDINQDSAAQVYRFKFTPEIMAMLTQFAKLHQFDDRKTYKEAWQEWTKQNQEALEDEERRLRELRYEGDINDKMYKAARYYFRKKPTNKKEPKNRRQYISVSGELLDAMDEHIETNSRINNYTPASGYDSFCQESIDLLKIEIKNICEESSISSQELATKIKKTYKNRYFIYTKRI